MSETLNFVTKKNLFWGKIRSFRPESDNYGTCPEIGQLTMTQVRYDETNFIIFFYRNNAQFFAPKRKHGRKVPLVFIQ